MSGGGGPNNSTVTQTTTNLPEYAEPYYHDLMQRAAAASAQPYQTYGGQRLADFSPWQQEAMGQMTDFGMSGDNQNLMNAINTSTNVANAGLPGINTDIASNYSAGNIGNAGKYKAGQRDAGYTAGELSPDAYYQAGQRDMGFEAGTLNDADMLQSYMSPYMQKVVDVQKREAMRDADIRNQGFQLESANAGGPRGNYRLAVLEAENEKNLQNQLGDIQAEGQQAAFNNAQQMYEQDRAARAQQEQFGQSQFQMNQQMQQKMAELVQQGYSYEQAAQQAQEQFGQSQFGQNQQALQAQAQFGLDRYNAYEQAKQAAAQMGLTAQQANQYGQIMAMQGQLGLQQNQLAAAQQMAGMAGQQDQAQMEKMGMLMGVGQSQQDAAQKSLDMGYSDWLRQQAYPWEQIYNMSNIMQGNSVSPGSTQVVYGQQPSTAQQLLGGGLGALGIYNAYNAMSGQGG